MADKGGNDFWRNTQDYKGFEMRAHRFRPETLPLFLNWLGIDPNARVLDAGCGTGVFTRFLARGLDRGHIIGFDINETFVAYGNAKLKELSLADRAALELADGYELHYPDETFDAVTNYTYLGVLSDPETGLRELIRVCKPGGTVSCVIATNALPQAGRQGEFPFDPNGDLERLARRENRAFSDIHRERSAKNADVLSLFRRLGLRDIRMYPFAHLICYSDAGIPLEYRRTLALDETREEIDWLKSRYADNEPEYEARGFTRADFDRLTALLEQKLNHYELHFEEDASFEWHGGYNYIVTGKK